MNIRHIYEGWKNNILRWSDVVEQTAAQRLEICKRCTFHSERRKELLNYSTLRPDVHCVHCGCTLSAKTRCMSCSCPINLWTNVLSSEEEEKIKNESGKSSSEDVHIHPSESV